MSSHIHCGPPSCAVRDGDSSVDRVDELATSLMTSWFDCCHRARIALGPATAMGERLVMAYTEPHRHYHGLAHISACLELVRQAPLTDAELVMAELALWFQDAVYDPRASDNEQRSAELASAWIDEVGAEGAEEVAALIAMTKGHVLPDAASRTMQVVHDIDLSILGADPVEYERYVADIRAEYAWLSDHDFAAGRAAVLEAFLRADAIFALPGYRSALEASARRNLTHELGRY